MLTYFDPTDRNNNRSLLFLVSGPEDAVTLSEIENACSSYNSEKTILDCFNWFAVPDQRDLAWIDPNLDVGNIARLEVCEFKNVSSRDMEDLLHPVLDRIVQQKRELFPCAGGAAGGPAEGIQFLDRQEQTQELSRLINEGKNILLLAPRRSGKTSLILRLCQEIEKDFNCHFINLERHASLEEFAARFKILSKGGGFRAALKDIQEHRISWDTMLSSALEGLTKQCQKPLVLFLDELVFFFENVQNQGASESEARNQILALLELLSEKFPQLSIRLLVAGSGNLFEFLEDELGIRKEMLPDLFATIQPYYLKSLDRTHSELELKRIFLGSGMVIEGNDNNWIKKNLDLAIPYPALNFLDRLSASLRHKKDGLKEKDLERELSRFVANTDAFKEFDSHLQGLQKKIPKGTLAATEALSVLTEVSFDQGVPTEKIKQSLQKTLPKAKDAEIIFAWLCNTFPIEQRKDHLIFVSRLFYRWWKHQIEQGG
jgi:hypothetical protein